VTLSAEGASPNCWNPIISGGNKGVKVGRILVRLVAKHNPDPLHLSETRKIATQCRSKAFSSKLFSLDVLVSQGYAITG
jgi:hypothetical protein